MDEKVLLKIDKTLLVKSCIDKSSTFSSSKTKSSIFSSKYLPQKFDTFPSLCPKSTVSFVSCFLLRKLNLEDTHIKLDWNGRVLNMLACNLCMEKYEVHQDSIQCCKFPSLFISDEVNVRDRKRYVTYNIQLDSCRKS